MRILSSYKSWLLMVLFMVFGACAHGENTSNFREGLAVGSEGEEVAALYHFLEAYGYLEEVDHHGFEGKAYSVAAVGANPEVFDERLEAALKLYQQKQGLTVSGVVDQGTMPELLKSRCGVGDFGSDHMHHGHEDHGDAEYRHLGGKKWPRANLTYCFDNFTADLSESEIRGKVRESYDQWSKASGLQFTEVSASDDCDMHISWEDNDHGDGHPFSPGKGAGQALAHGFPPSCKGNKCSKLSGDLHLSNACTWVMSGGNGITTCDIGHTVLHELGHALGLDHSEVSDSIMVATYTGLATLTDDDITGIQALYTGLASGAAGVDSALSQDSSAGGCQVGGNPAATGFMGLLLSVSLLIRRRRRLS